MSLDLISLKPFCSNRYSSQVYPSFSHRAFFLHDFSSPDFLDSFVFPHYDCKHKNSTEQESSSLSDVISQVSKAFDSVRVQINFLELQFMLQLTSFMVGSDKTEELHLIKNIMKKCHSRLLQSRLDPKLIDEFAELLNAYDKANKKTFDMSPAEKMSCITKKSDQIKEKLNEAVESCLKLASSFWPSTLLEESIQPESNLDDRLREILRPKNKNEEMIDEEKEKEQNDEDDDDDENDEEDAKNKDENEDVDYSGTLIRRRGEDYYLLLKQSNESKKSVMLDLKQKRAVYYTFDLDNLNTEYFYADSLNLLIATNSERKDYSVLTIYRLGCHRLNKAARIKMSSIPLYVIENSVLSFQMLYPQYMVAVISSHSISLLNIFTRRVVKQYFYKEPIKSAHYMRQEKLFVVIVKERLLVYDISDRCLLSTILTEHPIAYEEGLTVTSNIIAYFTYREDFDFHSEGFIQDDSSIYEFHLFKVTRQGVRKCQTKLQVRNLVDSDYYEEGSYRSHSFQLRKYIIRPESEKIKVFYSIKDDRKSISIQYKFEADESKKAKD